MALTRKNNIQKKYNDQECWEQFMSWGAAATCKKLKEWHIEKHGWGSPMGVVWAMWRWSASNPEQCYPQYKTWFFETASNTKGEVIDSNATFKDFLEDIKIHAKGTGAKRKSSILSHRAYKQFCAKWNLEE